MNGLEPSFYGQIITTIDDNWVQWLAVKQNRSQRRDDRSDAAELANNTAKKCVDRHDPNRHRQYVLGDDFGGPGANGG